MKQVRPDKVRDLRQLQADMNYFRKFYGRFPNPGLFNKMEVSPYIDLSETRDDIFVKVKIPGVDAEDVKTSLSDKVLSINVQKKRQKETKEESIPHLERSYRAFSRKIGLPCDVAREKIEATYEKGVLKIRLSKYKKAKTSQIRKETTGMLVKEWMSTDVITVKKDTSMNKASKIMKEKQIRSLPVVNKKRKLVGIITDRDLKRASPSIVTSLNVHELNDLISKVKVKDIMTTDLVIVKPDETVDFAAILMLDNKISSLPVISDNDAIIGIITQTDIFKTL